VGSSHLRGELVAVPLEVLAFDPHRVTRFDQGVADGNVIDAVLRQCAP
jgi:hypothetical protein